MDGQPERSRYISGTAVMDSTAPSSLFADLTRHSTGIIPSCTSSDSSLHSRYIQASLPLGSASTCPYLGGMYAGSLPAPPNSPFRSPTGNIRQFWPPTPPPEGYNRYGVSPAIYPLFPSVASIAPSSENGTLLTPGLGSRLGTLPTHFPHLLDSYSDPTYYSSAYGLGSSLPPSSHVTPNLSLSNLTPTLERHPSYVPLVGRVKGLSIPRQQLEDEEIHRGKGNNFMKWDIPYTTENTKPTKTESQPKSKDNISKDDVRSASSKGKGENRISAKKNEIKHPIKQTVPVPPGGDSSKPTSVINGSLSSVPSENYDLKSANSRSVPECPKCVVTPSSVVRPVNSVEAESRGDSDAVISLVHMPSVATVTKTVAPSLPNCTVANSHINQPDEETVTTTVQHPTAASQQPPTAITYVSRQLCYQSISESTVSKSLTGTSSCLSVKISGHVTSVSSSQVVLDSNKNLSEEASPNTENETVSPIWNEQKPVENASTKDFQKAEEPQSEKADKMPSVTSLSNTLPSPAENTSPVIDNSLSQMKDHSQHALKVPSSVSNIPTHQTSNRLSSVYCKNIRNTKLGEQVRVSDVKEAAYIPLSIQPKKEQSSSCKIEQVKPSLPNNWNRTRSHEIACDTECEPQAINLSLTQKLPKSEPNELPNCKTVNLAKAAPLESNYLPVKSLACGELSSNSRTKSQLPDTCLKTKKISAIRWPQTQNLSNRFGSNSSCQSRTTTHSLGSVSVRSVKSCLSQQPVVPSSTPITNVSSLVKPTLSASSKSSLKSVAALKLPGRGTSDSNCHRNSISVAPSLSSSIENTRKSTSDDGQNASNLLPTLSLPFSGTVNSSIPIGIAIAQQRQETTTSPKPDEKREITEQSNHVTSAPVASTTNLMEVMRDQKSTDRIPRHSAPADAGGVLVTLGPTTLNTNQWDSDATRTSMSQPWMTHTPVVAPTVWVGQSVQSTPAASTTLPVMPVSTLDTSQVPISTGGFQLARDPLTGHLYLIPATKLTDHAGMWPVFVPTNSSVPLQQVVPHSQNSQVIETDQVTDSTVTLQQSQTQIQSIRLHTTAPTEKTFCDINTTVNQENQDNSQFIYPSVKQETKEEKSTDISLLNSLPVATSQPFAYAAFSLHGGTVSYYFEPTSVVHLAQTQVTASIQTESGKRSQGTSPLHSVTPSPPPTNPTEQGTQASGIDEAIDEGDESDDSSSANQASTQTRISSNTLAVATATQVDMNSDDDYEERNVEMSDSACQTEAIIGNMLRDEVDDDNSLHSQLDAETNLEIENESEAIQPPEEKPLSLSLATDSDIHIAETVTKKEFCPIDVEIASDSTPVLTAESKPVMDFIDHHGLDLLVDSIEEFACREQEMQQEECKSSEVNESSKISPTENDKGSSNTEESKISNEEEKKVCLPVQNQNSSTYPSIDPFCVDGLGLLCALAEQRFLEEKMNSHDDKEDGHLNKTKHTCSPFTKEDIKNVDISNSSLAENKPKTDIFTISSLGKSLLSKDHKRETSLLLSPGENMDAAELEMRIRMAELQHKYKQKQQELSRLRPKTKKEIDSISLKKPVAKLKGQQLFTYCKSRVGNKPNIISLNKLEHKPDVSIEKAKSELDADGQENSSQVNKCLKIEKVDDGLHNSFDKAVPSLKDKTIATYSKMCNENNSISTLNNRTINTQHQNSQGNTLTSDVLKGDGIFLSGKETINSSESTKTCVEDSCIQSIKVEKADDDLAVCKENEDTSSVVNSELLVPKTSDENTLKTLDIRIVPSNNQNQHNIKDETERKVPFFDESVWSIRRSERIFLHEAGVVKPSYDSSAASNKKKRTISLTQSKISEKLSVSCSSTSSKSDSGIKQKISQKLTESTVVKTKKKIPVKKTSDLKPSKKINKIQNKKSSTELLHSDISSTLKKDESEESSSSDSDSSTSDESDSSSSDTTSSDDSDDTPLSALIRRPPITTADAIAKAESCIMTVESLQDKQRVLMMDDGLFYGGHVIAIHAPDVYGIHLDGDRGSRHRIYSREEMLKETVLEVKPTSHFHLIEGSRVCAFWSQQYRCLYPGTVTKSNSPPDDGLIYVEFDDGDSGRIPLEDICLLPPNYPIVTVKPTPHLALKRRHCISSKQMSDAKKKILYPLKDSSQPSKMHKVLSSKKVKTNHPNKRSHSPCHSTKVTPSPSNESIINGGNVLSTTPGMSLSMVNARKDTKIAKQSPKITAVSGTREKTDKTSTEGQLISKLKKHKRHHEESKHHHHHRHHHHHHHHHHRHHHHHHKRHKHDRQKTLSSSEQCKLSPTHMSPTLGSPLRSSSESSVSSDSSSVSSVNASFSLSNKSSNSVHNLKKSELTVKIKTNPTDTHLHTDEACNDSSRSSSDSSDSSDTSSDEENSVTAQEEIRQKVSTSPSESSEKKGRDRRPSVEKSKIAAFLPARQLWRWSGNCFRRRATKGRAKKDYYRAVTRGKETIKVGDCAVFLSTGRPHLPYIGRIETMWQSWGGNMVVKVKWFYHPEETRGGKRLAGLKGALFQSSHLDENDVQTISHKCEVLSWDEYKRRRDQEIFQNPAFGSIFDNNDIYYLAGTYEPTTGIITMEPGIT